MCENMDVMSLLEIVVAVVGSADIGIGVDVKLAQEFMSSYM